MACLMHCKAKARTDPAVIHSHVNLQGYSLQYLYSFGPDLASSSSMHVLKQHTVSAQLVGVTIQNHDLHKTCISKFSSGRCLQFSSCVHIARAESGHVYPTLFMLGSSFWRFDTFRWDGLIIIIRPTLNISHGVVSSSSG